MARIAQGYMEQARNMTRKGHHEPTKAFGLTGTYGMDKFEQEELPKPTRWEFAAGR